MRCVCRIVCSCYLVERRLKWDDSHYGDLDGFLFLFLFQQEQGSWIKQVSTLVAKKQKTVNLQSALNLLDGSLSSAVGGASLACLPPWAGR